jgi:hypothetical protein
MAKRLNSRKRLKVARREWARFTASGHGQGPHRNKKNYTRKRKHRRHDDEQ